MDKKYTKHVFVPKIIRNYYDSERKWYLLQHLRLVFLLAKKYREKIMMKIKNFFIFVASVIALLFLNTTIAIAGTCPAITMTDTNSIDIDSGKKMLLSEFEKAGDCTIATFTENPKIAEYNAMIIGNSDLPPVADRLPDDPVVFFPNNLVGNYGGTMNHLGNNTEAGTGEFCSVRNTNLVVFDDLVLGYHSMDV